MDDAASSRLRRIRAAIEQYQGRLIAFAARITGDVESGRDVVQETFLRLCREDLDGVADHLPAWLFRVCRNRALDVRKKEGPLQRLDQLEHLPACRDDGDPHVLLQRSESARRVLAAVAGLPAAQQEVLRLRFQEELSYRDISAVTGHSVGNVGFLIHTGIRELRRTLRAATTSAGPRRQGGRADA